MGAFVQGLIVFLLGGLHFRLPTEHCPASPSSGASSTVNPDTVEKIDRKDVNSGNVCFGSWCIGNWTEEWIISLVGGGGVIAGQVLRVAFNVCRREPAQKRDGRRVTITARS